MPRIRVHVAADFLVSSFRTGNIFDDKIEVSTGLPEDAKLVHAQYLNDEFHNNILELTFETKEPDYRDYEIIIVKFTKYIEDDWK